jgi:zinc transport system ATP-binding protein
VSGLSVVRFENVGYSYGETTALENVTLDIAENEFVWIVGPNGGGKTTLVKLILGLLEPDSGRVVVFGETPRQARRKIGYMPQSAQLDLRFPVTVLDVALMGRLGNGTKFGGYKKRDLEAALDALSRVGLAELKGRAYSSLSGGQLRRLLIARALASQPQLLILDEPTANLDLVVARELLEFLSGLAEDMTVIMVSHDPAFVSENVREVICVNRRAHMHPTTKIDSAFLSELYSGDLRMVRHDRRVGSGGER